MKIKKTKFEDVLIVEPYVFNDERGFFYESFSQKTFFDNELNYVFVQDNQSHNKFRNTFRGLHYQMQPKSQTTLVRVINGKILDIVVDIRKGSPSYGEYITQVLSDENNLQLLIPKGFAHGFLTLTDNVNILYKMDDYYSPELDRILNFSDKNINLNLNTDLDKIIIADKDKNALMLNEIENNFIYGVNC